MTNHESDPQRTAQLAELVLELLSPEDRARVEADLATDPTGLAELELLRRSAGILALACAAVAPSPRLRERVLGSIEASTRFAGFRSRIARLFEFSAERADEILAAIGNPSAGWVDFLAGVRLLHFEGGSRVAHADCGLVEVAPEATFPAHEHRGDEWSLVLQGRAEEDTGVIFEPGDLVLRNERTAHSFRALGPEPFVFAVVLHGGFHPVAG